MGILQNSEALLLSKAGLGGSSGSASLSENPGEPTSPFSMQHGGSPLPHRPLQFTSYPPPPGLPPTLDTLSCAKTGP